MARILIADDEADIRHLLTYTLADEGHEVSTVADGKAAIEAVAKEPPDLLVLDVMMPGLDGYGVLEQMQELDVKDAVKVLMLTAKGSDRDWKHGYDLGADRYMTKPFDPDEFLATAQEMLECSKEELEAKRQEEADRSSILSQLESIFGQ